MQLNANLNCRVLKKLANGWAEHLGVILEKSWKINKLADNWRRANVVPIFLKAEKKRASTEHSSLHLTLLPGGSVRAQSVSTSQSK